ncbi:MAG: acyltransferase, partial [Actinobacteria bacterium]|nr:acyltransferase [Actinomycetota bacterium]
MADASPAPQPSPGNPQQAPETSRPGPPPAELARARPAPAEAAGRRGNRLAWLDALRGFAALCVVFDHAGSVMFWHVRAVTYQWIDTGQYGVFVFFLVSGYIVPASLERKGSVRTFWVSRVFRLYPLYVLALVAGLVLWRTGWGDLRTGSHPAV